MPDGPAGFSHDQAGTTITKVSAPERELSTIGFPYCHMEDATGIARAMLEQGGGDLSRDQLETIMAAKGGNFPTKFGAARMFGFVQRNQQGRYYLTDLGHAILSTDETQNSAARHVAFLNIPLYKRTFVDFKDTPLPSRPVGLENAFVQMGVAPKQKEKARIMFEKSAQYAGFFRHRSDQLVKPITSPSVAAAISSPTILSDDTVRVAGGFDGKNTTDPMKEPLIHGLLIRLPEIGSDWPPERRVRWLQLLANVFDVVYSGPDE